MGFIYVHVGCMGFIHGRVRQLLVQRGRAIRVAFANSWCSRSSELFRQEFSVDNFLKPPTVLHTGLVDAPAPQVTGEFRSANVCKYVRSS